MDNDFVSLFSSYWWLLFPLAFFIAAGWSSFMRYKRTQAKIELLKSYAASGQEPPKELLANLDSKEHVYDDEADDGSNSGAGTTSFLFILFAGLAGVFAFAGYSDLLGDMDQELYFVAMILGVLALAFLVGGLFGRRR
ncbi:MAG: hypothetical protein AAFX09_07845 [Pseudomonadota bacterium]